MKTMVEDLRVREGSDGKFIIVGIVETFEAGTYFGHMCALKTNSR